ncbi:glycosyltransferase family 4 protein [Clostridium sp. YIM B02551]|uniref:glycosyltransferase family 4 protein n=1 Tax=Clostridium sp. YIM B02551 TaxID=2910679 RepID=UPI001EEA15B6|nr:glycosyltransferase family 4 protein [Clostridium sp. YIM B02551]
MKILIINMAKQYGGAEKIIEEMIIELCKRNFSISVASIVDTPFYLKLKKLSTMYQFDVVEIASDKKKFISILGYMIKYIRMQKITLIHSHGVTSNVFGSIAATFTKVPNITTIHSRADFDRNNTLKGKIFILIERMLLMINRKYILVSNSLFEYYKLKKCNVNKLVVMHNAISHNKNYFKNFEEAHLENQFTICAVGRLTKVKGFDILIDAMNDLVNMEMLNIKCVIIGEGEEEKNLYERINSYNLGEYVELLGFKDNVKDFMIKSDCLVMSSLMEGIPIVLLEALSLKLPVIVPRVGGIPEIIDDSNGILFEGSNFKDLSNKIKWAYENRLGLKTISKKGYDDFINNWNIDSYVDRLCEIYDSVLEKE